MKPDADLLKTTLITGVIMFLIEKTPADLSSLLERTTYPFELMDIGDSFFVADYRKAESARISAIQFCKRKGKNWKFTQRKMDGGWRIIRVS